MKLASQAVTLVQQGLPLHLMTNYFRLPGYLRPQEHIPDQEKRHYAE